MNSYEAVGKTVDEAIKNAVVALNVKSQEDINIEVIQEGSKGFFGIGSKEAKVIATIKQTVETLAVKFVKDVATKMGVVNPECELNKKDQTLNINITGENTSVLIGKRGVTLDAVQTLVNFAANKGIEDYVNIRLDTENYREARIKSLEKLATNLALKVKKTQKNAVLEPMSSYERRVIHSALQDDSSVETYSEGSGAYRHVIIKYVKK